MTRDRPRRRSAPLKALLLSVLFSGLFSWLFLSSISWPKFRDAFTHVQAHWFILFVALTTIMVLLRGARSVIILSRLKGPGRSNGRLFTASLISFGAILLFPFRTGELVRPWLLASPKGNNPSRVRFSALIGVSVVERVLDGLIISVLLLTMVLYRQITAGGAPWLTPLVVLTALLFSAGTVLLALAVTHPGPVLTFARRVTFLDPLAKKYTTFRRLSVRFESLFTGITTGFATVANPLPLGLFISLSLLYWVTNALSVWALGAAFGIELPFAGAATVMSFIVIGIFIPSLPAHIGNFHHFATLGLSLYLPAAVVKGSGLAMVVALHALQLAIYVLLSLSAIAAGGLQKPRD